MRKLLWFAKIPYYERFGKFLPLRRIPRPYRDEFTKRRQWKLENVIFFAPGLKYSSIAIDDKPHNTSIQPFLCGCYLNPLKAVPGQEQVFFTSPSLRIDNISKEYIDKHSNSP